MKNGNATISIKNAHRESNEKSERANAKARNERANFKAKEFVAHSQKQSQSSWANGASSAADGNAMAALRFNALGNKLCGLSRRGQLFLWHFNVPRSIYRREFRAYHCVDCHDKAGCDVAFVGEGGATSLATAGESASHSNVCVWDLLFAQRSRALIRAYQCYEGSGANCIAHIGSFSCLAAGGHKGVLHLFDRRMPFAVLKWQRGEKASNSNKQSRVWRLAYLDATRELLVGTLDGSVSIWDMRRLHARSTLSHHSNSQATQPTTHSQTNPNPLTSMSYASAMVQHTVGAHLKPLDLDECVVNEWKLFQRKTFLGGGFGGGERPQLGYFASVGLTDAKWTRDGDILCAGADGTVKYLRRKTSVTREA